MKIKLPGQKIRENKAVEAAETGKKKNDKKNKNVR